MSQSAKIKPESEVNAYLFYSNRLLNLVSSTILIEQHVDKMALTAAVCLSLKQAWMSWLKELSGYVGSEIPDYASLLSAEHSSHPEVQCLLDVSKQKNNWLSLMMSYFELRLNTPSIMNGLDDDKEQLTDKISLSRIDALQIDTEMKNSEEVQLSTVITEFKLYVNAVRSRQAEW
tara:strand:+ start:358 stop:882 length:525 start_codon:yes stop_codon:yes gene_type:complete